MSEYGFKEHYVSIPIMDDLAAETLRKRVDAMIDNITAAKLIYGDGFERPPLKWHQKVSNRFAEYRKRVSDAWDVLLGRVDPYEW